jgi:hypothetical protein
MRAIVLDHEQYYIWYKKFTVIETMASLIFISMVSLEDYVKQRLGQSQQDTNYVACTVPYSRVWWIWKYLETLLKVHCTYWQSIYGATPLQKDTSGLANTIPLLFHFHPKHGSYMWVKSNNCGLSVLSCYPHFLLYPQSLTIQNILYWNWYTNTSVLSK